VTPLLACRKLVIGHAGRAIAPPIELELGMGELLVVGGHNGSGKTTWVRTLLGLLPPISGSVEQPKPGLCRCYLGQRRGFDPGYPLLSRDVVAMGLARRMIEFVRRSEANESIERALALVDATELADRPFWELSEGQKQRVLLARVHATGAELAVLDEPTSAMDGDSERSAWERLKLVQTATGAAFVVVTHALSLAAEYASRAIFFDREARRVEIGSAELLRARASSTRP
jgi:zinc transport system ATP-binding protein